jgi:hypothetical protein
MLAARCSETVFQKEPSSLVIAMAQQGRQAIRQRFRQIVRVTTDPLLLNVFQRNGATLS